GGGVGVSVVEEWLHEFELLGHVAGRTRLHGGCQATEGLIGPGECTLVTFAHNPPGHPFGGGDVDDLVVDVGDVTAERDVITEVGQPAAQDVEVDAGTDVSDVGGRLHRGTTHVQGRTAFAQRGELADLSGTGVIEAQTHAVKPIPFPCTAASQTTAPYCLGDQRASTRSRTGTSTGIGCSVSVASRCEIDRAPHPSRLK